MKLSYFCCLPFVLLWQSVRIYVLPTIAACTPNLAKLFCLCACGKYQDKKFPSSQQSLGSANLRGKEVIWLALDEIFAASSGQINIALFSEDPTPSDVTQGGIGNCWLMSALACMATTPGAVQACFVTKRYSTYGQYKVRLFDKLSGKWRVISVSDSFPCDAKKRRPLFARPNGEEAWVLVMEKAFAKLLGSYGALDGGNTTFALQAMTGDSVCAWKLKTERRIWQNHDLVHIIEGKERRGKTKQQEPRARKFGLRERRGKLDMLEEHGKDRTAEKGPAMFAYLRQQHKKHSLIAASASQGGTDREQRFGIVQGHAYSVLRLKGVKCDAPEGKEKKFWMVQFRNPWGRFEWTGDWSDHSSKWAENPGVAAALEHTAADDGAFWMEWADVRRHFHAFDVCVRIRGFRDLALDHHEGDGACGPCLGCLGGCATFWCCCRGCVKAFQNDRDVRSAAEHVAQARCGGRVRGGRPVRSAPVQEEPWEQLEAGLMSASPARAHAGADAPGIGPGQGEARGSTAGNQASLL